MKTWILIVCIVAILSILVYSIYMFWRELARAVK